MATLGIRKINSISDLMNTPFEGYVWLSDAKEPIILHENVYKFTQHSGNPFIIEALLFDPITQKSLHITHDGVQHIVEYDLPTLKNAGFELVNKDYLSHRMKGIQRLHFVQLWKEENDPLCNDFPVLQLKATVFCGFKNIEL
jgi:CRISPR type III-associated protein (TIGR04423 family)